MTEIKGLLAGQILLCYMNMDERELNVTSLARTLGDGPSAYIPYQQG